MSHLLVQVDGLAEDVLLRIDGKGYAGLYTDDAREIVRIGVSFSSQT